VRQLVQQLATHRGDWMDAAALTGHNGPGFLAMRHDHTQQSAAGGTALQQERESKRRAPIGGPG
jgi:hypothetical protein